jgi:hypothetical protein
MISWLNNLREAFGENEATNAMNKAASNAAETLNNAKLSSASDLYKEGREAAGVAAADKAGIAKKEATAAAKMGNASKTMSALAGSQAANDAVSNGYDTTAANAAGLQAGQESTNLNRASAIANAQLEAGKTSANEKMANTSNDWSAIGNLIGLFNQAKSTK